MFYGLFVGIDLYTPPITRLSCARRDADSLAAFFSDTLAGQHVVLTDHDATLNNIDTALVDLGRVSPDDLVIVSFSGHGTPDHNLTEVPPVAVHDLVSESIRDRLLIDIVDSN